MSKLREGDIYLFNESTSGDIQVLNGEPEMDGGFESAVYISLFGNNGSNFWMNEYVDESKKIKSEFIGYVEGAPLTLSNINRAQDLAQSDLQWFIDVGIADIITVEITPAARNRIDLLISIRTDGDVLFENTYEVNWGFQADDPASGRQAIPETPIITKRLVTSTGRRVVTSEGRQILVDDKV